MQCHPWQPLQSKPVKPVFLLQTPQRRGLLDPRLWAIGDVETEPALSELFNSSTADLERDEASVGDEPLFDGISMGSEALVPVAGAADTDVVERLLLLLLDVKVLSV